MTPSLGTPGATSLYDRVRHVIPPFEWPAFANDIDAILDLKHKRNAIILAHNYQTPEIFHCVADIVGDSLALAREAAKAEAETIVLAGVQFMAETAKLLNPKKTVLIPDLEAGCSLADSITPADVRLLRERYPGVPIVAYVNTSAVVKAEADICCTSGNARVVVESVGTDRVIMLPDEYLAVEPQQVVLGKTEAADRCFGLQTSMRAMPIVTMQPVEQLSRSLPGVLISTSIGPFTKCGLDEALGLAVGSWSVGFGEDLAKAKALAGCSESL